MPADDGWLTPPERLAQARFTVPKRHDDWRLGRWTAKQVIAEWLRRHGPPALPEEIAIVARARDDGYPVVTVPFGEAPAISISHRAGTAVCIAGRPEALVGCDLERVEARPATFPVDWFTPAEQRLVQAAPTERRPELVTAIWSAKESALKAMGVGLRADTREVEVRLPEGVDWSGDGWRRVTVTRCSGTRFAGWWRRAGAEVLVLLAQGELLEEPPPAAIAHERRPSAGPAPAPAVTSDQA